MSAESDYADAVSRILLHQGQARAQGALGSGQAWGNFANSLGPIMSRALEQKQQGQAFEQEKQLRDQQIAGNKAQEQLRQQEFAANERKQREDAQFRQAIRDTANLPYDEARKLVAQHAPEHLATWEKGYADLKEKADISAKNRAEYAKAQQEYLGIAADHIAQSNGDPIVVNQELNLATEHYPEWAPHANQLRIVAIEQGKDAFLNAFKSLVPASVTKARADTADTIAQLPGHVATTQIQQQVAAGMQGGLTAEQRAQNALREREVTATERNASTNAARLTQDDQAVNLTPEALQLTAHQYAMTGQLPPMGMGKAGAATRTKIINAAADIYKNLDLPSQVAAYKANQASLKTMQAQRDAVGAFEDTAVKNLDQFLGAAQKVVDVKSPWLNRPLRSLTGSVLGSTDQAAFNAARQAVIPEFAKLLSNPSLSGQLTDSQRKEIDTILSPDATLGQIYASAKVLKQDAENRKAALDDGIAGIKSRIATPPSGLTTPAADKDVVEEWVRDPRTGRLVKKGAR